MLLEVAKIRISEAVDAWLARNEVASQSTRIQLGQIMLAALSAAKSHEELIAFREELKMYVSNIKANGKVTCFLAYKQGQVKQFRTEEEALKFSNLVEAQLLASPDISRLCLDNIITTAYLRAKDIVFVKSRGYGEIASKIVDFVNAYAGDEADEALYDLLEILDASR